MDVEDVLAADCVLSFTEEYGSLNKGGGRHFEMGLGFGFAKRMVVVGRREIIFHHLPSVEFFETLDEALEVL